MNGPNWFGSLAAKSAFVGSVRPASLCAFTATRKPSVRSRLVVTALTSNDFKNGMSIIIDKQPYRVTEFLHVKPGKGSAFVRTKVKNYLTGNTVEKTFRAGEKVEQADLNKASMQFTYEEGEMYVFMDLNTYEETRVPRDESWAKYLLEGGEADVLIWDEKVIGVDIANTVTLEVTETDPGVKGNTAQGGSKPCTLETGAVVQVPLFINIGDKISVDTRSDQYLNRVTDK
ncbi:hypothetical protein CYMTET_47346 [Cymbomonas tetramitiformis]|uniref:Elongation factor P n=1 Tax=Cymbomonas tetramitiformis TaxID=36881 RepID=A0AAE0BVS7_9CHLO|nr:hypothetical protein CYMTET_47346 [Cymbomonas tetramitiformis]